MATKIVTKNSSTASAVPTASDLVQGELAVNVADKKLFTEDNSGTIIELADGVKLAGIEALADVTDTANVTAAGALMDSELTSIASVKALNQGVATTDSPAFAGIDVTGTATMDGLNVGGNINYGYGINVGDAGYGINSTGVAQLVMRGTEYRLQGVNASPMTFYTSNTERMRIDNAGNVGIVSGDISLAAGKFLKYSATSYITPENNVSGAEVSTAGVFSVKTGATPTERMRIDSAGNVGIGTSSPISVIDARASGVSTPSVLSLVGTNSASSDSCISQIRSSENPAGGGASDLTFHTRSVGGSFTAPAERMRINSAGNVGIGTSSPTQKLHISDSAPFARLQSTSTSYNGFNAQNSSGNFYFGIDDSSGSFYGAPYTRAIYSDGAYPVTFYTNATERMRISSAGNVGIGTSSPTAKLTVSGTGVGAAIDWTNTTASTGRSYRWVSLNNGTGFAIEDLTAGSERMRIDSAGNVGIGTTSPAAKLHAAISATGEVARFSAPNGSIGSIILGRPDVSTEGLKLEYDSNTGNCSFGTVFTGHQLLFKSGTAERMRIDSAGNLLVGTTSATPTGGGFAFRSGTVGHFRTSHASGTASGNWYQAFYLGASVIGTITQAGTTGVNYNTSSDQRLKENIADADDAGSKIDAIQVRQFDWKADGSHQDYGVIAQELVEVAPEAVTVPADSEEMMGVDYSKLVPMLIKEIQSLRNRVAQLEE